MEELTEIRRTYNLLIRAEAHLKYGCFLLADATQRGPLGIGLEDRLQPAILDIREGIDALRRTMDGMAELFALKSKHPGREQGTDANQTA